MFRGSALETYFSRVTTGSIDGGTNQGSRTRTLENGASSSIAYDYLSAGSIPSSAIESTQRTLVPQSDPRYVHEPMKSPVRCRDTPHSVCNQPRKRKCRSNLAVKLVTPLSGPCQVDQVVIDSDLQDFCQDPIELGSDHVVVMSDDQPNGEEVQRAVEKKKKSYEASRKFQESWAAKLPWAECVLGSDGLYEFVKCRICSLMEARDKIIAPKWDTLKKHGGKRKAEKNMENGIKKGQWYIAKNCKHLQNERRYASRLVMVPINKLVTEVKGDRARKKQQMGLIFHLLQQGRPMLEFEGMKPLFDFLQVPKTPKRHWSDNAGWNMAEHMHKQILSKTKEVILSAHFISVTCDEVTTVDNGTWVSIHAYIVDNWSRLPILLSLKHIQERASADNLTKVIMGAVSEVGGLTKEDISTKLLAFGADGVNVFQGSRNGVVRQLQQSWNPRVEGIHCMAHRTNLAVQTLSELPIVGRIEGMLQDLYTYFSHSPKRHLEFVKLAEVMQTKGLKILKNIKTRWLSMLSPAVRVMNEYRTLLVKMEQHSATTNIAKTCIDHLTDVQIVVGLACLMPMLRSMHALMQYAQKSDAFICDFLAAVKICQADISAMYCDHVTAYTQDSFWDFNALINTRHDAIPMKWVTNDLDLNVDGVEYLSFEPTGHNIWAIYRDIVTRIGTRVTRDVYAAIIDSVKNAATCAASTLITELTARFPASHLMDAMGIIYLQYWLDEECEQNFKQHLVVIKAAYGCAKPFTGKKSTLNSEVDPLLSLTKLDMQASLFKLTLQSNAKLIMLKPCDVNPVTSMWRTIEGNSHLRHQLSEYLKIAEIAIVMVLGSVQDERTFSTVSFMKTKLRNRLITHLPLVVGMKAQGFYDLFNFPYDAAYDSWKTETKRQSDA